MVVVVGGGLAGWRTATELRRLGYDGALTVLAEEGGLPYDRPPLSKAVLAGTAEPTWLADEAKVRDLDIRLEREVRAVAWQPGEVTTADGRTWDADRLVVATGATPRRPAFVPDDPRVHLLRTLDDSRRLAGAWGPATSVVVVGGGFIGAEVASTARSRGLAVTLVEAQPWLAAAALGDPVARLLTDLHREHGVDVRLGSAVASLACGPEGARVELADGAVVTADLAVVGLGVAPRTGLLAGTAADTSDGIRCDPHGRVLGLDGVWAAGDVARWQQADGTARRREHWSSAADQAVVVAHDLLGLPVPAEALGALGTPYVWSDQHGVKVQVLGRPDLADAEEWLVHDGGTGARGYLRAGRLVGVVTLGPPRLLAKYRKDVAQNLSELTRPSQPAQPSQPSVPENEVPA